MHRARRIWKIAVRAIVVGLAVCVGAPAATARTRPVLVFAAASLKNALDDIGTAWTRATGRKAVISYAGSNALAKQIEAGAPADIFFSADLDWMDYAVSRNLVKPASRVNLLGNALVLVAPKESKAEVSVRPGFDLAAVLGAGRLAMANVDAVPAGKYGRAALENLGAWQGVRDRIAQAESARAALLLVSRGEAPLGIVYRTDAASDPNVRIVADFPQGTHPPITYPVALTTASQHPDAQALLDFLRSGQAKLLFEKQGFTFIGKPASGS